MFFPRSLRNAGPTLRIRLPLILAAALAAAAPLGAQPPAETILVGQVIDAESRRPLAAATIRAGTFVASTAGDGQFRLVVPPGTYSVMIHRLGYEMAVESWVVAGSSLDVGMLELAPDAVKLATLQVVADRMERMRLSSGIASQAVTETELATSAYPDALQFVSARHAGRQVPCGTISTEGVPECVRVRGQAVRVCAAVDDAPLAGGLSALAAYDTRELARINIYAGGAFIQVYTRQFMAAISERGWQPKPVEVLMQSLCRFTG